ncbi:MAG: cation diffusion facilitator family transporter [Nitrospirales bacterium]|nr:cation transporter [Nitrospira sp.]MDR4500316.1 cation diffusion facilitator family transporter [Nitrospirales bacterium]
MASGSKKVIYAALIGNALIAVTKFAASAFTGSSAMLAEGIHSLVDTGNQGLLLYGLHKAKKPPDEQFPFGHGKEVYFWSFVVAILIFALGAGISLYEGVLHILHPEPIENPMVNYVVLGLALIFEGGAWYFAFKEFSEVKGRWSYFQAVQRGKDPTMFLVLFEDSAAVLGLIVAFVGIWLGQVTGIPYLDGVATVIIGLILGATAVWLAYETKGLLIGESANREVVQDIRALAEQCAEIKHVNEVLTMHMGPDFILVNVSVDFRDGLTSEQVESTIASIDHQIKHVHPRVKRVFIEAEKRRRQVQEKRAALAEKKS